MPKFLLQYEAALIREIPITKKEITVGRKPDNDIVIDNPAVSGHHCRITLEGSTFFVEDLKSSNGVFVNSRRIVKSDLKDNDIIGLSRHTLKFVDDRAEIVAPATIPENRAPADATVTTVPGRTPVTVATAEATPAKKIGFVRVVKGVVNESEYRLNAEVTQIGRSERVQIKIKGAGFFSGAPENAAMIASRAEGYFIVPIAANYTRLNGRTIIQKELLKDGDMIQLGGTTLKFEERPGH